MIHQTSLDKYPDGLAQLAQELGDLRYDALAEFLFQFSSKLELDSAADLGRGRSQLANSLAKASKNIEEAAKDIQKTWQISEPYMK